MAFITDKEREQCVMNDTPLYRWWVSTKQTIGVFVRNNRQEIDETIQQQRIESWRKYDKNRPNNFGDKK